MSGQRAGESPSAPAAKKIFVADDDPIVLKFLEALLTDSGYEVRTASDGEKALAGIRVRRPDLPPRSCPLTVDGTPSGTMAQHDRNTSVMQYV